MTRPENSLAAAEIAELYAELKHFYTEPPSPVITSADERALIQSIRGRTSERNRTNLTRTSAYLEFHCACPEIHWALLAHLVSRNGGYSMTDLHASHIGPLLKKSEKEELFRLLETINASIFADAYPQLLLYEESKKRGRDLSYLLPAFRVSSFMIPIWTAFFKRGNRGLLTAALITNEQSMIEVNMLSEPETIQPLLKPKFILQEKLGLTYVLFPYKKRKTQKKFSVTGLSVSGFQSLDERIHTGKRLYHLLYSKPAAHQSILSFCKQHAHTGSRADYWPHLFSTEESAVKAVSPYLETVWPEKQWMKPAASDWYKKLGFPEGFETPERAVLKDLSHEALSSILSLAPLSALSKKWNR
ncbi:DUF2515 domain-containing protein [Bacillus mangrovi]|uniref:DUF2515 domain-containing protein n=1 Tax=Metabacillus mangrovi TaxID=1491830 RepID=A0A7X2V2F5_9BACI|nr:DUF2515 family protein [Metabacillus mangrovi]MTH52017.1 DUF2515 domain-containing protein [Metabacillus mangrovi]